MNWELVQAVKTQLASSALDKTLHDAQVMNVSFAEIDVFAFVMLQIQIT